MSITLTHVAGPLAGQTQTFGDDRERIVIGRDSSQCDVVFPPDTTLVGREHCALLRKISGDYALDVYGQHYVGIDGEPAVPDAPIASGQTIHLGRHDGPSFKTTITHAAGTAELSETVGQQEAPSIWRSEHRTRIAAAVALVLAIVAGGAFFYEQKQVADEKARGAALVAQMASLNAAQKQQAADEISPDARQHLAEAVYAVILRTPDGAEDLLGTAWGVAPDALATNAHVAAEFFELAKGGSLIVRPSGTGQTGFNVKSVTIHPGYAAFNHFVNDDKLLVKGNGGWQDVDTIGGYDVALLHIDGTLPESAVLQIADDAELEKLQPGSPLAFAGYPYENVSGDSVQPIGRTSIVQLGNETSATDYFLLPSAFPQRHLIEHSLPATGGASGSPIIDAQGHVVALLSAGNITQVMVMRGVGADAKLKDMRIPNAALINYGQRVDVLRDLLDGGADSRLKTDEPYWTKVSAAFKRGADVVIDTVLAAVKPDINAKPVLTASGDYPVGADARYTSTDSSGKTTTIRYQVMNIDVAANSRHFIIAYGKSLQPISAISLIQDGKIVERNEGRGAWAALTFTAPADATRLAVLVEVPDNDIDLVVRDYVFVPSGS